MKAPYLSRQITSQIGEDYCSRKIRGPTFLLPYTRSLAPAAQEVDGRNVVVCFPPLEKGGRSRSLGDFGFYGHLTDLIQCHSLGILGTGMARVHFPGQY